MDSTFDHALARLLGIEGDYADHPHDRGGKTRWGITERVARAYGYTGPMDQLPVELAQRIYREQYWDLLKCGAIAYLSEEIAYRLFDFGVNAGVSRAASALQRSLNLCNRQAHDYGDLIVDGVIGQVTIASLRAFLARRGAVGESIMLGALKVRQGDHWFDLAEIDPTQEDFVCGWFARL